METAKPEAASLRIRPCAITLSSKGMIKAVLIEASKPVKG
jgi:hypothetical protein